MHFCRIAGSISAAKTFSGGAVNAYVTASFIETQDTEDMKAFFFADLVLSLIRGLRRALTPASPGRARDVPGTPQKRVCRRADRLHPPLSGRPLRSSLPRGPNREATLPRRPHDRPSLRRLSPRWQPLFARCPPPLRRLRLQTRSPSART